MWCIFLFLHVCKEKKKIFNLGIFLYGSGVRDNHIKQTLGKINGAM